MARQFAFAERVRPLLGLLKPTQRCLELAFGDRLPRQFRQAQRVLGGHLAFAAFPGMKLAGQEAYPTLVDDGPDTFSSVTYSNDRSSREATSGACCDKSCETLRRRMAKSLGQLIEFKQNARVGLIQTKGFRESLPCGIRVTPLVEVGQPQIPPDGRQRRIAVARLFPAGDGQVILPAVVPEIAKIVGRLRVCRVGRRGSLQWPDFFQPVGEAIVRSVVGGAAAELFGTLTLADFVCTSPPKSRKRSAFPAADRLVARYCCNTPTAHTYMPAAA